MNRRDFQALAAIRLKEAGALLQAGHYEGAYYLAGYAVECALKACVAKQTQAEAFPPKDASRLYTHELGLLLQMANLKQALQGDAPSGSPLERYWTVVQRWSEESRYARPTAQEARDLHQAITAQPGGVLQWLQLHW